MSRKLVIVHGTICRDAGIDPEFGCRTSRQLSASELQSLRREGDPELERAEDYLSMMDAPPGPPPLTTRDRRYLAREFAECRLNLQQERPTMPAAELFKEAFLRACMRLLIHPTVARDALGIDPSFKGWR